MVSFRKHFPRSLVIQGLVGSLRVIELEPGSDSLSGLSRTLVFIEVHLLVLNASPKPFGENVVDGASLSVHADLDVPGKKTFQITVTREMAPLVAVENVRESGLKSPVHTVKDKRHLERLIQRPGDDIPGMPVDDRHEVHPSVRHVDVGDVDSPDVVRILGRDIPERIRIDFMFQSPFAEIGPRMDPFDAHLSHSGPSPLPSRDETFLVESGCNVATPEESPAGVDIVDPVPKPDRFRRRRKRPIIQDRLGDTSQSEGNDEGKVGVLGGKPVFALCIAQLIPDFL